MLLVDTFYWRRITLVAGLPTLKISPQVLAKHEDILKDFNILRIS